WVPDESLLAGLVADDRVILTSAEGRDRGVRLRDLDQDGRCELIVSNDHRQAIFARSADGKAWAKLPFALPDGVNIVNEDGKDNGVRFMDVDDDGYDDVLFSNQERYGLYLFTSMEKGWSREVKTGKRGDAEALPMITRSGTDNGAWFHSRGLWVVNENTDLLKDHVERRSFNEMLEGVEPTARTPLASLHSIRTRP